MRIAVWFFVLTGMLFAQAPTATQMGYTYSLAADQSNVTLGVKDSTGALIRTIFHGRPRSAGNYSGVWDGLTDTGQAATGGPFAITLLYGNPSYSFDGRIGDTSNNFNGYNKWSTGQEYLSLSKISFIGSTGWITQGSSEGTQSLMYFADTNPNTPTSVTPSYYGQNIFFTDIDNDGQYLYLQSASCWNVAGQDTFVTKFDGITGRPVMFSQGTTFVGGTPGSGGVITNVYPGTTMSNIDINPVYYNQPPTSIAAQTGGNILAVGHGDWLTNCNGALNTNNVIKFFDKTTGLPVGSNATLANPTSMAFNSTGNLFVISMNSTTGAGTLSLITSPSGANTITHPISGLSNPIAVAVNKATDHIYILDGGTSQQMKEFDSSYNLVRTYGVLGGYTDCNPTVAPNRLMVDNTAIKGTPSLPVQPVNRAVRVESNGDVWITDSLRGGFSGRIQHVTPSGTGFNLVHQILYTQESQWMSVSHTQPTRIFQNLLEYSFNYNVPNLPGDPQAPGGTGSWQLVRDWAVGLSGACGSTGTFDPFNFYVRIDSAEQFSNGHVYATISGASSLVTVELPTSGTSPARPFTPPTLLNNRQWIFTRDGSFHTLANVIAGPASTTTISKVPVTGFDGSNNPIYGAPVQLAQVTFDPTKVLTAAQGNWAGFQYGFEATTGGTYAVMQWVNQGTTTTKFPHIGGMVAGRNSYLFTVNPEVCAQYLLPNGSFPCGANFNNGPNMIAEGRHIIVPFTTNSSQVNGAYWHYWEDGMFIGQFGPNWTTDYTPTGPNSIPDGGPPGGSFLPYNPAVGWQGSHWFQATGYVENSGSARGVMMNGDLYMFITSEAVTAPIGIWKMSNLASIHEIAGTGTLGQSVSLTTQVF